MFDKKEWQRQYYQNNKQKKHDYYIENKERIKAQQKENYEKHKEAHLKRSKKWKKDHPIRHRELCRKSQTKRRRELKEEVIILLGGQCANPYGQHDKPYTDVRALQIDHVNGGGTKESKNFSNGWDYYHFVLAQIKNGSKDYQCLCANCNWIKRFERNETNHV